MSVIEKFNEKNAIVGATAEQLAVYEMLNGLGISFTGVSHDEASTMEACREIEKYLDGKICKNLFLCNSQETSFYLLLMSGDKPFKTKFLSKQIGSARLSFASPENMQRLLGVMPGSASVLALMNDKEKRVSLLIDKPILEDEFICCHPCKNTATLKIATADILNKFLPSLGITFREVELPDGD